MGDISAHFDRVEFSCNCGCGFNTVDIELIKVLEDIRQYFGGEPITVTSGCRCPEYNESVGGKPNSEHLKGRAADIMIEEFEPKLVHEYLYVKYPDRYGIGKYTDFTHVDTRSGMGRWG